MLEAAALFFKSTVGKMIVAAFVASLFAASVSVWATGVYYRGDISDLKRERAEKTAVDATASLKQLQKFIDGMHFATTDYGKNQTLLFGKLDKLAKEFARASSLKPLPLDCKPDADRLHFLAAAVAAANAAAARQ